MEKESGLVDATSLQADNGPRAREAIRAATERRNANPPPIINLGSPDAAPAPRPPAAESPSAPGGREESPSSRDATADSVPGAQPRLVSVLAEPAAADSKVPDAQSDDAESKARRWLQMHGGNATAAHAKALEDNNRLADQARRIQELEAQVEGRAPAEMGTAPEPVDLTEEELDAAVRQQEVEDQYCRAWHNEYSQIQKRIDQLVKYNETGQEVDGELPRLRRQIFAMQARLDPKSMGLDESDIDEVTRAELEGKLELARSKQERLLSEKSRYESRQQELDAVYTRRAQGFRDQIVHKQRQVQAEKAGEAVRTSSEKEFKGAWATAFGQVSGGYSKEDAAYLETHLLRAADVVFNSGGDIPTAELVTWMHRHEGEVKRFRDRAAGKAAVATAVERGRHTAQPAPTGSAAVAPPETVSSANSSARDRRRAAERQAALRARSIAVR